MGAVPIAVPQPNNTSHSSNAVPRTRLDQAASALVLVQRLLGKITEEQLALNEENAQLKQNQTTISAGAQAPISSSPDVSVSSKDHVAKLKARLAKITQEKLGVDKALSAERAQHRITADKLERCRLETTARTKLDASDQDGPGISKAVITELALKLIEQGPTASNMVAGLLLDEVARVAAKIEDKATNWEERKPVWTQSHQSGWKIEKDKGREDALGLTQRLMTLEGISDVTLGRVSELERDVRRLKGFESV